MMAYTWYMSGMEEMIRDGKARRHEECNRSDDASSSYEEMAYE